MKKFLTYIFIFLGGLFAANASFAAVDPDVVFDGYDAGDIYFSLEGYCHNGQLYDDSSYTTLFFSHFDENHYGWMANHNGFFESDKSGGDGTCDQGGTMVWSGDPAYFPYSDLCDGGKPIHQLIGCTKAAKDVMLLLDPADGVSPNRLEYDCKGSFIDPSTGDEIKNNVTLPAGSTGFYTGPNCTGTLVWDGTLKNAPSCQGFGWDAGDTVHLYACTSGGSGCSDPGLSNIITGKFARIETASTDISGADVSGYTNHFGIVNESLAFGVLWEVGGRDHEYVTGNGACTVRPTGVSLVDSSNARAWSDITTMSDSDLQDLSAGTLCWCRLDSYWENSDTPQCLASPWVYLTSEFKSVSSCQYGCADSCARATDNDMFRTALFNNIESGSGGAQTYNATYSCNGGSGTAPSAQIATSGQTFTPAANTCTKSGYSFVGWTVSGTNDVVSIDQPFTWGYSENKTLTAVWRQTTDANFPFSVTTTNLSAGDVFTFGLSAVGTFYVNWGDGNGETIARSNTTDMTAYSHTYTSAGSYTIRFGGTATDYYAVSDTLYTMNTATISFSAERVTGGSADKIASIYGNLSTMFPYKPNNAATGAQPRFPWMFQGATNLTSIPSGLFSGYTIGSSRMFSGTFQGCTSLTTIPDGFFSSIITAGANSVFGTAFAGCSSLTAIPPNLFGGVTTLANGASNLFVKVFEGCSNLSGYIPPSAFAGLIANNNPIVNPMWHYAFSGTQLATTCPAGTTQYITGYESEWNGKVACTCGAGNYYNGTSCAACTNTKPANSHWVGGDTTSTCVWACDAGYINTGTSCVEPVFSVTTTALPANTTFSFKLATTGTFYVNWGDGVEQTITRTDTTITEYSHTYANAGTYTIGFGGVATNYSDDTSVAAISFYKPANGNSGRIVSVSGDLSALFPYITANSSSGAQPRFVSTFQQASLTSVPATLFSGYTIGADNMFNSTFMLCTSLTTIPAGLFSGITTGASNMFQSTFRACRSIVTIPTGLFNGLTTGASYMFQSTFLGCTSLTTIPSTLFSGITTGAQGMFATIFYGCTSLTTIPSGLFSGITTGARGMFTEAFAGCTNLTTIPSNLFGGITTSADVDMFAGTFGNCTSLTTIPGGLFSGITASAGGLFKSTFSGCTSLSTIPSNLFGGITAGAAELFRNTFKNCTSLTSVPASLFSNVTATSGARQLFQDTFNGCTGLTAIPAGLFSSVTTGASQMFSGAFNGCTSLAGYIPPTTFAGLVANDHPTATNMWTDAFTGTQLVSSCPATMTQYITGYEGSTNGTTWNGKVACVPDCGAGKYLPAASFACSACAADSYCDGTSVSYSYNTSAAQGIAACPTGMYAPAGMWESGQCGRILHIGDQVVYLRNTKKTTPSLHLDIDNDGVPDLFGNMTTQDVPMTSGSEHKLKLSYNNTTYSVYDDSVSLNP